MLAKRGGELPRGGEWIFEPKWDGFRAVTFRDGNEVLIQSRDGKSRNRYFPERIEPLPVTAPNMAPLTSGIGHSITWGA